MRTFAQQQNQPPKQLSSSLARSNTATPELNHQTKCPTQFQQHIAGTDYRVHVVGAEIFACEGVCEADDCRYAGQHAVDIRACRLSQDLEDRCRRLATAVQLPVAGIDLRQSLDGDWYCFEVTPSPAFTYYQEATGQPISRAIVRLLATAPQA